MPELSDSTPPASPPRRPMPTSPPEPPPKAIASEWEEWEGFRFTFLRHFRRREDSDALVRVAQLLYSQVLETPHPDWPELPGPDTRWELVAVLSDLRFLEGYLTSVFEEHRVSSLPPKVEELCRFAGGLASDLADIGFRLNEELAKWRG